MWKKNTTLTCFYFGTLLRYGEVTDLHQTAVLPCGGNAVVYGPVVYEEQFVALHGCSASASPLR